LSDSLFIHSEGRPNFDAAKNGRIITERRLREK
jgi:hypothetical protein